MEKERDIVSEPERVEATRILNDDTLVMVEKLGGIIDRGKAFSMIDEAFKGEKGAKASNSAVHVITGVPYKEFVNTTDEGVLYPELYKQCLVLAREMLNGKKQERAVEWLEMSREEWEKRRAAEPLGNEREAQRHDVLKASECKEKEPQRGHTEQDAPKIPTLGGYEEEELVFSRALAKGYMALDASGHYEWHKSKSLLAYMLGRIYCGDRVMRDDEGNPYLSKKKNARFPQQRVIELFGVNVANNRWGLKDKKAPPSGFGIIDDLFKD